MLSLKKNNFYNPKGFLSIIIPISGKDRERNLNSCLYHINRQELKNYEILIVEEGTDSKITIDDEILTNKIRYFLLKREGEKFCKSKCFNYGVSLSRGDVITGLDCDFVVPMGFFNTGMEKIEVGNFESAFIADDIRYVNPVSGHYDRFVDTNVTWKKDRAKWQFHGGSFFIKKTTYNRIGGFYEKFVGYGSEDSEFYTRVLKTTRVNPFKGVQVMHINHETHHQKEYDDNKKIYTKMCLMSMERRIKEVVDNNSYIFKSVNLNLVTKPNKYTGGIGNAKYLTNGGIDDIYSDRVRWIKNNNFDFSDCDVLFFENGSFEFFDDFKMLKNSKCLILTEPVSINNALSDSYKLEYIENNFDYILTHDESLLSRKNTKRSYIFCPHGGTWITHADSLVFDKSKNISMLLSDKRTTIGHRLRHDIVDIFSSVGIEFYGKGVDKPIENKIQSLRDYRFSIIVENCSRDFYFTEKLIDCFLTGTIPIYFGCPSISKYFDKRGIIQFSTIDELSKTLDKLDFESVYKKKLKYVLKNFEIAKKYSIIEDWILENFLIPNKLLKR